MNAENVKKVWKRPAGNKKTLFGRLFDYTQFAINGGFEMTTSSLRCLFEKLG